MNPNDYRKQVEGQLAAEAAAESGVIKMDAPSLPEDIDTLGNSDASDSERMAALQRLGAASFNIVSFAEHRAEYLEALRDLVRKDVESIAGKSALEVLAIESDAFAQEFLKKCLTDPDGKGISQAHALRLLSIDEHASVVDIARKLFNESDDLALRTQALRSLAADPKAEALMAEIFADKSSDVSLRKIAGTALKQFNPGAFGDIATGLFADTAEDDDLRAASLTTLANIADNLSTKQRAAASRNVAALSSSESAVIGQTAKRLSKRLEGDADAVGAEESAVIGDLGLSVTKKFE